MGWLEGAGCLLKKSGEADGRQVSDLGAQEKQGLVKGSLQEPLKDYKKVHKERHQCLLLL